MTRRLTYLLAALALILAVATPASAAYPDPRVRLYTLDGFSGLQCVVRTWDANLNDGLAGSASGPDCGADFGNNIESLRFVFDDQDGVCWVFYSGINYGGTAYVFQSELDGDYELPGLQDNVFESVSKGVQGAGSACIAQHP